MALTSQSPANSQGSRVGCPFTVASQLNDELCNREQKTNLNLPGYSHIKLENQFEVRSFLHRQLVSSDLESIASRLWWMSKQDSASISPLHLQLVKKRKIVATEDPKLHITWLFDRAFVKPLPEYLISYDFWNMYLAVEPKTDPQHQILRKSALGYLRTFLFLI